MLVIVNAFEFFRILTMTITSAGILAQGTLGTTGGATLYTVPSVTYAFVTSIRIVNTDTVSRTFNIFTKLSGGTSRHYSAQATTLAAGAGIQICDDPQEMRLGPGDIIAGDGSVVTVLEYTIMGVLNQ